MLFRVEGWRKVARQDYLFTSESVSEGHPDKVCDRISDEIVDAFFSIGPKHGWDPRNLRVAAETLCTTNRVVIAGETRGPAQITPEIVEQRARAAIKDIGYEQAGFHWKTAKVEVLLHAQSADIAQGVDAAGNKDEGAGDQGIMFGYACRETPELMPAPLYYAHKILKLMADARHAGQTKALGPDAKSQVTVRYAGGKPVEATQIVVSTQHTDETLTSGDVKAIVEPYVKKALPEGWITKNTIWHVNPTGKFVIGGPDGDCRAHRPQDHRRHLRRRGAARRRRVLGQGPDQGRPFGRLCRALSRQERDRGRISRTAAPSSSPMRSACRSRSRSMSICTAPARSTRPSSRKRSARSWICRRAASASIWR